MNEQKIRPLWLDILLLILIPIIGLAVGVGATVLLNINQADYANLIVNLFFLGACLSLFRFFSFSRRQIGLRVIKSQMNWHVGISLAIFAVYLLFYIFVIRISDLKPLSASTVWGLLANLVIVFAEELYFRGMLYGYLQKRFSARTALVVSSLLFGLFHARQGLRGMISKTFTGWLWGSVRYSTGMIFLLIIPIHMTFNSVSLLFDGNWHDPPVWGIYALPILEFILGLFIVTFRGVHMSKLKRAARFIFAILGGLLLLALLYAFTFYPAEYTLRLLRWGDADVYDYQKFPERPLPPSNSPFNFSQNLDKAMVQSLFEMDTAVDDLDTFLAETGTQAFIVIQNDAILYEKYFNGAAHDSIVTSFSVAKSFTSALVGIAIEEGHIHSVHDPITDYLPELTEHDPAFANITIRDLLLMSSGIRYAEFPFVNGDDAKTYYYPDLRDLALNQTAVVGKPGETFLYNNYHPLLLGMILERATGQPVADYLAEKIWQPMGAAYAGSWSLDENGFEKMESGINGRAIDFAKFGRLFLHEGDLNGVQIVPAEWVRESTQADAAHANSYYPESFRDRAVRRYYQYMWWGLERSGNPADYAALGNHGQFIYISPHKNLIIVRHGETYGISAFAWLHLFYDFATEIDN